MQNATIPYSQHHFFHFQISSYVFNAVCFFHMLYINVAVEICLMIKICPTSPSQKPGRLSDSLSRSTE